MSTTQKSVQELVSMLRDGTGHLAAMAKRLEFPWEPSPGDPRKLHNMYVRNLVTAYVSKFADLSNGVLHAIEHSNFLTYAVCGRGLIETTAVLRHYCVAEYKPLMDKGALSSSEMKQLIEIDDRHLRGGKFDWQSFLAGNYSKLVDDVASKARGESKRDADAADSVLPAQVRTGKCVRNWAKESPEVQVAYDLFCDLVHPNVGSTFLVASTSDKGLYFSRFRGEPVGRAIFEQSFPLLLSVTHKPFGQYLTILMGTAWQDDELQGPADAV
jgi:hypothetical protein